MEKIRISNIQMGMLSYMFFYGSTGISNPTMGAKRDAWMSLILACMVGFALVSMHLFISKLNQGESFVGILEKCFGKVFGKVISILYIMYFLHIAGVNIRAFGEFMSTVSYPDVPIYILMGTLLLLSVYMIRSGIETIARLSEIFILVIPLSIILVFTSITTMSDYTAFEPMLLEIAPIIKGGLSSGVRVYGDFIVFLMIIPYTNSEKGRFKAVYVAMFAIGVSFMLIITRNIMLLGPELLDYFTYPSSVATQMIPGISIDPILDITLIFGGGFRMVLLLYTAIKMTAEVFQFEEYKPIVCAFAVLVMVIAFWVFTNSAEAQKWSVSIAYIIYSILPKIVFPIIILIVSIVKKPEKPKVEA